jgi:hypothetical protein
MLLLKLATDDILSLFIYSSFQRNIKQKQRTLKTHHYYLANEATHQCLLQTHIHTHKQIKTESLKTRRKQSNPSIAYLDLLLCVMNHSIPFQSIKGITTYLHTRRKQEYGRDPYQVHT